jgi:tRNA modification GTPase
MFSTDDTIVAVATPPGRGGIGVVRLAGPAARPITHVLLGREQPLEARHATVARVVDPGSEASEAVVDEVVVTWFAAPHSYTGDDVVEISGHGSPLLLRRIVELAMAGGARLAEPGEFTLRAYLNGRIDLVQAEAVADLVEAVTPLQARAAMDQLEGTLTGAITAIDATLFDLTARLEASLDFPEEGFHFAEPAAVTAEVRESRARLERLAAEGRTGRVIREGRLVVMAGLPNAGKSSLFNALAGAERAIVTRVAGTTRDVLTERVDLAGVPVTLVDTAGLGDAVGLVEAEGLARARQAQDVAALRLLVIDGSVPLSTSARQLMADVPAPRVLAVTKNDLPRVWAATDLGDDGDRAVEVSALTGEGLDRLRHRLVAALTDREELRDAPAISNVRHLALVDRALESLDRALVALEAGATEEVVLADLASARRALEELTGTRTPDDVLAHIFARFCIGK